MLILPSGVSLFIGKMCVSHHFFCKPFTSSSWKKHLCMQHIIFFCTSHSFSLFLHSFFVVFPNLHHNLHKNFCQQGARCSLVCVCVSGSFRIDGVMRTMNTEKLIKTLPIIQNQLDALLDFQVLSTCVFVCLYACSLSKMWSIHFPVKMQMETLQSLTTVVIAGVQEAYYGDRFNVLACVCVCAWVCCTEEKKGIGLGFC